MFWHESHVAWFLWNLCPENVVQLPRPSNLHRAIRHRPIQLEPLYGPGRDRTGYPATAGHGFRFQW